MTTFAEKDVIYVDGQINVMPLPEAIMANGFIPETRDAPGMPLAAQHLNWLFRDLYRQVNKSWLPAWVPIPCPMENAPEGFLKCNGATFDKEKYPELAKGYPSGVLPDLRGEFIRGWDDERGIDAGRNILSTQSATGVRTAAMDYYGSDQTTTDGTVGTAFVSADSITNVQPYNASSSSGGLMLEPAMRDNSIKATQLNAGIPAGATWITVRPRNIAFLYIVRAA